MSTYIIRHSIDAADLVCDGRIEEYVSYRGLLHRTWNRHNGQGPQFQEACRGLTHRGGTIPVAAGQDVAKIMQMELSPRPAIRDADAP
jgi:hypothetical protein